MRRKTLVILLLFDWYGVEGRTGRVQTKWSMTGLMIFSNFNSKFRQRVITPVSFGNRCKDPLKWKQSPPGPETAVPRPISPATRARIDPSGDKFTCPRDIGYLKVKCGSIGENYALSRIFFVGSHCSKLDIGERFIWGSSVVLFVFLREKKCRFKACK